MYLQTLYCPTCDRLVRHGYLHGQWMCCACQEKASAGDKLSDLVKLSNSVEASKIASRIVGGKK